MHRVQRLRGAASLLLRANASTSVSRRCYSSLTRAAPVVLTRSTTLSNNISVKNSLGGVRNASAAPQVTSGKVDFKLADVGEGIAECEILKWHIKAGDTIKEFDPLCEVQSDKATVEITSRYDGIVTKLYYNKGEMAKVGSPLVEIDLGGEPAGASVPEIPSPAAVAVAAETVLAALAAVGDASALHASNDKVLATPAVRHIAKTKKIDLTKIKGTGRDGRVLKEDILAYESPLPQAIAHAPAPKQAGAAAPQAISSAPACGAKPREQKVPLSGIKRVMARTMTAATQVPHFGYNDEFIIDNLQQLRAQLKPIAESHGTKITYMPFFIKAVSLALLRYPNLNATIAGDLTEMTIKNYHNIGVAMDTPQGLVVPNIKDVQDKSIIDIAKEMQRLHQAAINNQLSPSDMTGGTFTLSNIGTIGGTYASPVLVLPEVVIGAIGKIQKLPRYDSKGNIVPVHLLRISWSADHRAIDGATIALFSNLMKQYVEHPETMLAQLR